VLAYDEHEFLEREIRDPTELEQIVARWSVTWINVDGLGDSDILAALGRIFKLHPLALEDVANTLQRPKVDDYDNCLFIVARMVRLQERLDTEQLSIFLGEKFVLTSLATAWTVCASAFGGMKGGFEALEPITWPTRSWMPSSMATSLCSTNMPNAWRALMIRLPSGI
jgi:hypothetical protein